MKELNKLIVSIVLLGSFLNPIYGQEGVGIGTESPNPNAVLDLVSPGNNQGFLVPRLSTNERNLIANLTNQDNGLLVYDLNDNLFYYWHSGLWNPLSNTPSQSANALLAGEGLEISENTIVNTGDLSPVNEIQDLQLSGDLLSITGNDNATSIDLSKYLSDNSTVELVGTELIINKGESVDLSALDSDATNELQDLELNGNILTLTKISNATEIDLSPFAGVNTDNQRLSISGSDISISGGNSIDISSAFPTSTPPSGVAGGDLNGNYPNPTIRNGRVTTAKVANNAINSSKIANGTITNADINGSASIEASKLESSILTEGEDVSLLNNDIGYLVSADIPSSLPPSGTAGGDLSGSYPNPIIGNGAVSNAKLANNSVNSSKIANGTITNADISNSAGIAASKLQSTVMVEGENAGGDLNGTYPNPTIRNASITNAKIANNAVNSSKIQDNTITTQDVSVISGSKINPDFEKQNIRSNGDLIISDILVEGNIVSNPSNNLTPTSTLRIDVNNRINQITGSGTLRYLYPLVDGLEVILIYTGTSTVVVDNMREQSSLSFLGNIVLNSTIFEMNRYDSLHLIYMESLNAWVEITRSVNQFTPRPVLICCVTTR